MNEKAVSVLEQYELEPLKIFKQRGNYGCNTAEGKYLLLEYDFSEEKLVSLFRVQDYLEQKGIKTEKLVFNREGHLISVGEDGFGYVLKRIYDVEECDIHDREHVKIAAKNLARFHKATYNMEDDFNGKVRIYPEKNLLEAFQKHNRELVNIRNFIEKRRNKNFFERYLQHIIEGYYRQGQKTVALLEQSTYQELYEESCERKQLIHGNYNHHALAFEKQQPVLVNLTKVYYGPQIHDVYDFLRKVLEKNAWKPNLGHEVICWYDTVNPLQDADKEILKLLLSYPEKFWKIVNYYYNSNKAWYSDKNEEKLKSFQEQEELRWCFIHSL